MSSHSFSPGDEIESALRAQRTAILERIRKQLHHGEDSEALSFANYLDVLGDEVEAENFAGNDIALIRHDLAELKEIDAALASIAMKTYGICANCGEQINPERLRVQPAALLCIACQETLEDRRGEARRFAV